MSTPNFKFMLYGMPLVVGGMNPYEDLKERYEEETSEEYTENMFFWDLQNESGEACSEAENFTETLKYHDVTVESGYYIGFQFFVEEKHSNRFDLDKSSKYCIDNEDAHYYFDVCRSVALREADREKRKIRKWLEKIADSHGYENLVCCGVFSNGEAVYKPRTPRTELIAAAKGYI